MQEKYLLLSFEKKQFRKKYINLILKYFRSYIHFPFQFHCHGCPGCPACRCRFSNPAMSPILQKLSRKYVCRKYIFPVQNSELQVEKNFSKIGMKIIMVKFEQYILGNILIRTTLPPP